VQQNQLWCDLELDEVADLVDERRVVYELFHTAHVIDGMRCRHDFKPSMADDATRPNGAPHAKLTHDHWLTQYIQSCILATGDRLLWPHIRLREMDLFRQCNTDAVTCLQHLAAVPRTQELSADLAPCVAINGPHWQILLAAARYAFDLAYNTPYCTPSEAEDDHPLKYPDEFKVHRPNHALAHAIRQTWYCPFMLQYLRESPHMDQAAWGALGPHEVLSCQLRLIFEATGRKTDFGWKKEFSLTSLRLRQQFVQLMRPGAPTVTGEPSLRFITTNFKVLHAAQIAEWKNTKWDEPGNKDAQRQLMKNSLRDLLVQYCEETSGLDASNAMDAFVSLTTIAVKPGEDTADFAVRLWTADAVPELNNQKLYSILNAEVRRDDADRPIFKPALTLVCMIQHHLNSARRYSQERPAHWPKGLLGQGNDQSSEKDTTFRGGQLPSEHLVFYQEMQQRCSQDPNAIYRVPGLMATSFDRATANSFVLSAPLPQVLWTVKLKDPEKLPEHGGGGCMQVNFINKGEFVREREFLFSAYSAFRVLEVDKSGQTIQIVIEAAIDNKAVARDVPSAPWY